MWRKVALERYHGDPPMRSQSATTVMGSKLYVFGGLGAGASNNLWALDSVMHRWQRLLPPKGAPRPPARSGSAMCGDEEQGKLYLLGGLGEVNRRVKKSREGVPGATMRVRMLAMRDTFSDCWEFDAASGEWREITFVQMSPPPRRGHTCSFASGYKLADAADEQNDAGARSEDALSQTGGSLADFGMAGEGGEGNGEGADAAANVSLRLNGLQEEEAPRYVVLVGGAGPDPKGFENVLGQPQWALDLATMRWFHLPCTGCVDAAARFEHTTTKIGEKLWVVGGMTLPYCDVQADPNQDITQPTVTTSTLKWGSALQDIASLDLETLVWTRLDFDGPSHPIHGHAACESPTRPGELLIVGGYERVKKRHLMQRRNTVNTLLPKAHGSSHPSLGDTTPPPVAELLPSHEDLEDTVTIRAIRVTDDVPLMRKLPTRGQPPPPSYGMVCLPWNGHKLSMSKLRRDRGAELEERGIVIPGGSKRNLRRGSQAAARAEEKKAAERAGGPRVQGVTAQALVNQGPCLLFYGGARTKKLHPTDPQDGFSSSELYLYDCLWAPPESESDADPDDAPEDLLKDLKKDADSVQRPDDDRSRASFGDHASLGDHGSLALLPNGGLSFAPSTESGPGGASSSSRAAQKKSEADLRFFLDQLEVHGGELPGGYDAMKQIILQRRPDHTTSKLRRGEKVPRAPPWLAASQGHGTKGLNASHSNRSLHGAAGDAPGSADAPGEKGLTRTHTAPAGLGRPSTSGGLGRPSTSNSTLLDPLDARSTVLTSRPRTAAAPRPLPKHDLRQISAHTLKAMPSGSTIWRARDLFQYDVAMASLTRPRTAFSETQ